MSPILRKRRLEAARTARALRPDAPIPALLEHINREVAILADAQIHRLWPVMEQATRSLTARLRELTNAGKGDTYTAAKVRAALLQTQRAMRDMAPRLASELSAGATVMQRAALGHMSAVVAKASARYGHPVVLDLDMADFLMDGRRMLIPHFRASAEKYAGESFRQIRAELAVAKVEGLSWGETAKRISTRVESLGVGYQAERLVRSEMVGAHARSVEATAEAEGYERLRNAALYRACAICGPMDGKLNQRRLPVHPNCRCNDVLWLRAWGEP